MLNEKEFKAFKKDLDPVVDLMKNLRKATSDVWLNNTYDRIEYSAKDMDKVLDSIYEDIEMLLIEVESSLSTYD